MQIFTDEYVMKKLKFTAIEIPHNKQYKMQINMCCVFILCKLKMEKHSESNENYLNHWQTIATKHNIKKNEWNKIKKQTQSNETDGNEK